MIRINLLGHERQQKKAFFALDPARRAPLGAAVIGVLAAGGLGGWYWTLDQASKRVDADLLTTQGQADRLKPILAEVKDFEDRRAQLQQRVAVIEELRTGQSVPVQLLDAVSRSVPDMLWLTELDQKQNEMRIEGRSTTLIALSDFVGNLGSTGLLMKPIEIVSSQVESLAAEAQIPPSEIIKFTVKAQLVPTTPPPTKAGAASAAPVGAR